MQLDELSRSDTKAGKLAYEKLREKFTCRMWDLGRFMQSLKQCFTHWYNSRHGRRGTMWEARYKSVLVEDGHAARMMAAYIDLNPIRAAMVKKPEDYRWCSYAEAVVGGKHGALARKGLARVLEERENQGDSDSAYDGWEKYIIPEHYSWRGIAGRYRVILFEDGEEIINERVSINGKKVRRTKRKGFSAEEVEKELGKEGKLGDSVVLRCKTRSFVVGGVIGGKEFVKGVVERLKGDYLREDRKSLANKLPRQQRDNKVKNAKLASLWSMRRIVKE